MVFLRKVDGGILEDTSRSIFESREAALLCRASELLARLDERLGAASPAVRIGWTARMLLQEASASARLDEVYTDVHDLLLADRDTPDRLADQDSQRAHQILQMLRAVVQRDPRQLFTPRRLMAAARLRFRERPAEPAYPRWIEERRTAPEEIREVLAVVLDSAALAALRARPPLIGVAAFLARWQGSGAADAIGGASGRALACAWLRRVGAVAQATLPPLSVGFLGYASDFRPANDNRWQIALLEASARGSEVGLRLLDRLGRAEARLREHARPRRTSSRLPPLVELMLASPAVSAADVAGSLRITPVAARRLLDRLMRDSAARELTGRTSFRLFSVT